MKRVLWHVVVVLFLLLGFSTLVSAQAPTISALSPTQGTAGSSLTISGSGYGSTQGNSKVIIAGSTASVSSWSSSSVVAVVPSSAPVGSVNVQVLVNNLYSNTVAFTVLPVPTITTLSINAGPVGAVIIINGTGFGASQASSTVTFNGVLAIPNSWSDTSISVTVPQGATTGKFIVPASGVPVSQPVAFMVVPPAPTGVGFVQGNYFAVQSSTLPSTIQTVSIPYPVAQTQGDLDVIVIGWRDTKYQVQSVTDTSGNTYSIAAPVVTLSGFGRQVIYYAPHISGASANSVTVTFTGAAHLPDIRISEYKGVVASNPLDVTAGKSATSGTLTDSGFATTTNADDVLVGANLVDTSITTIAAGVNYTPEVLTTPRYDIYEDRIVTAIGSYNASAPTNKSGDWIAQMAAFKESANQAPIVNAGPNQTIKLPTETATLNGTISDDGLPNNTLTVSWSQVSGPSGVAFSNPSAAITNATFPGVGTYVLQLSASDGQLSSSATTTITVIPAGTYTLTLSPPVAGPDVVGTSQALSAVLMLTSGATTTPIAGATVQFTVTGANAATGTTTTDSTGTAQFSYTGGKSGTDSVQASYASASASSNTTTVTWLVPAQPVSTGTVFGRFFTFDSSGSFDATPATPPVFTQYFPTINFNPPAGTIPGTAIEYDGTGALSFGPHLPFFIEGDWSFGTWIRIPSNGHGTIVSFGNAGVGTPQNQFPYAFALAGGPTSFDVVFGQDVGNDNGIINGPYDRITLGMPAETWLYLGISRQAGVGVTVYWAPLGGSMTSGTFQSYPQVLSTTQPAAASSFNLGGMNGGQPPSPDTWRPSYLTMDTAYMWSRGLSRDEQILAMNGTPSPASLVLNVNHLGLNPVVNPVDNATGTPVGGYTEPVAGKDSSVSVNTRPWTDVVTDANGNSAGTIVAQGNGYQAGAGSLTNFQVVFTGTLTVRNAGNVTFNFYADDGFIFGVGGGATRVSGALTNPPASGVTPFTNLPVLGSNNVVTPPVGNTVIVNFPAAGTYDYELDYFECCGAPLVLTMATTQSNGTSAGVPPTGSLTLNPTTPSALSAGQNQAFTVLLADASGAAVQHIPVGFTASGANQVILSGVTDATGHVTFQYTGINAGTDTLQASAVISGMGAYSNTATMTWNVVSGGGGGGGGTGGGGSEVSTPQGVIGSPANGAVVQGQLPITVASGVNLTSGTLTYWPLSNPSAVTTLNASTTGTGTIGTFDATLLPSGGYAIKLDAIANGTPQISYVTVTVVGDNKPGRITSTVTDFKVPLAGIPISITRTYDSLERSQSEDFGFGWKLGTTVGLSVDLKMDVTFNFNGQRETFYFQAQPQNVYFAWILYPQYVPQPGLHGTLTSDGCPAVWNVQGTIYCLLGTTPYQPTTYVYTDPSGRVYTISASGQLQSVKDLNGNILTVAANGITSSVNGVVVRFVRDGAGRITQITDTNGKNYIYSYDQSGNLQSVQYPSLTGAETYTYFSDHTLQTDTDPRGNSSSATYYTDGRLQSITDGMHNTWNYSYNLATNTKTTTNPDGGVVTETDDSFGKPLSVTDPLNRTTTYVYDGNENLTSMTDPLHKTAAYTYDGNGFQTSVTDPLLHKSTKTYNQFGGVLTATDAANTNAQTTSYDQDFNPVKVTDLLNGNGTFVKSATFDQFGNISTFTDADQNTSQLGYDPNGNLNLVIDPLNETRRYLYDAMGRIAKYTDASQNATLFSYDDLGRLKTKTDALQNVTNYTYDDNSNKTSETDGNRHITTYQYDALNRVSAILYPDNTSKSLTYDFRGNKLTEIDQLGRTTKYVYDLAGQLMSVTFAYGTPDTGTASYIYDADGRRKTVTDELNHTTTYNYDDAGRLTSVLDAMNNVTSYGYDADNRQTGVTDANQHTTSYIYDARGRLITTTYPTVPPATQATSSFATYDGMGRLLTATDQAGNPTTRSYDLVGRFSYVMDALHNITRYGYDPAGNLTSLQDTAQRTTTYQYDALNRRKTRTLPLHQAESYTYDPVGNLATKTDFNGKKTTHNYDTLNRLLSRVPDPSLSQPTVSFTYTGAGQRVTMTDASGPTTYTFDNRDRVLSKATPEGTLSYTYDAHGNVLTIASANSNGASLTYVYDALNRLSSATDNRIVAQGAASGKTSYGYDAVGNLVNYIYPSAIQTSATFDPLNRVTQMSFSTSGNVLASYAYTLNPVGMRLSAAEQNGRTAAYGYDNDYRLTSEAVTNDPGGKNGTVNYTYDLVGNRTQQTSTLSGITGGSFSYDANDRLTTDAYDNNGNTVASGGSTYAYNFENRLLASGGLGLVYDGDGNRVAETVGGVTTKYLMDTLNPTGLPQVLDEIVSGSVTRTYAYGLQRLSENQFISGAWTPSFYGYDGHGNVRFLTSLAGTVTDTYQYDAFGNQIANTGTTPNSYLYSGEHFDSNVGFYDLRARYYRQSTGRFWTRDPIEGKKCCGLSWNPYIYTKNNPVNQIDPTGKDSIIEYAMEIGEPEESIVALRKSAQAVRLKICVEEKLLEWAGLDEFEGYSGEVMAAIAFGDCFALENAGLL